MGFFTPCTDAHEFEDMRSALNYISTKLKLPMDKFVKQSDLLKELLQSKQTTLDAFMQK